MLHQKKGACAMLEGIRGALGGYFFFKCKPQPYKKKILPKFSWLGTTISSVRAGGAKYCPAHDGCRWSAAGLLASPRRAHDRRAAAPVVQLHPQRVSMARR